ncbi:hypothetical protein PTSG_10287 [Salpingoeca rosetta]|uniref:Uncharacterized protein n=1 Tax=Salpingoeca rosetta (strain ATCC 50818 / BSB-021) TaxID=946362 RepID=F2UQV7_SALR5|nr:uncharacterized protein PTSG_10287 [Salpingoeca rosetta]EGD80012.1 hypothetical protein PTSG_10287 [Salpingoeca rosetta]|eukprot:XP_004988337.1 hypothetical protein PTSG_10287 [Salpingoeca rosetta]
MSTTKQSSMRWLSVRLSLVLVPVVMAVCVAGEGTMGDGPAEQKPIIAADDHGNLVLQSGRNGTVLVEAMDLVELFGQVQAIKACAAQGKLLIEDKCVSPIPGKEALNPASSCEELRQLGFVSGVYFVRHKADGTRHVVCDMSSIPATNLGSNGDTRENVGYSCKTIQENFPENADGTKWISIGEAEPFQVTCMDGFVELDVQGSNFSSTGWMFSQLTLRNWYKCDCSAAMERLQDLTGEWYIGTIPANVDTLQCEAYFDIAYKSGGHDLTAEQVTRISSLSKSRSNRNFDVYTTSCDDDFGAAPSGHWIAIETFPGSGNFETQDCTSGNAGDAFQSAPNQPLSHDMGCCDHTITNIFDSFPFPLRACASINSGGGVALSFSERVLRIQE